MSERSADAIARNIGAYNDAIASRYDEATKAGGWSVNNLVMQALNEHHLTAPSVLDLGAGTGQTIEAILKSVDVSSIVAVDASMNMLNHLRRKFSSTLVKIIHNTIESYTADADATDNFDLVTAIGSLEFVNDLPGVLGRTALLLQPRGILLATYIQRKGDLATERTFEVPSIGQAFTEYYWQRDVINNAVTNEGLTVAQESVFPAYQRGSEMVKYTFLAAIKP